MHSSDAGTVHIIGAGLAGLAAAERLTQSHRAVAVHEATAYAGGRCRSYHDQTTGMSIDNGTHLLLSGNHAALSFTEAIGSRAGLRGPDEAQFPFIDLASGEQWTLRFGDSRFPWWVFHKDRRVPQTAQYHTAGRVGETCRCTYPRNAGARRPSLPAVIGP
jgi:choline dehydrogenase-like flavoprotein